MTEPGKDLEPEAAADYIASHDRVNRIRSTPTTRFRISSLATSAAIGILILSGCATTQMPPASQPAPEIRASEPPAASANPETKPKPVARVPVQPAPAHPVVPPVEANPTPPEPTAATRLTIRIETHPQGAVIVVDGRPVGRSPIDVVVDTANNGFFKQPVTIRARFLASDENAETFSIDEQLTPLERVPLSLVFSKAGVQRILRQF